jgi:hypothetical protein
MREIYFLVRKSDGKRELVSPRRRCKDNIRMNLRKIEWKIVDWIHLALDRDQWRALVKTVMNLRVPLKTGNFLTS